MVDRFFVGFSVRRLVVVSAEMVDRFAGLSGDTSPLHVDSAFAQRQGFRDRVAHGLLLGALVSGVIGTQLPGSAGVLHEFKLAFHNPCHVGEEVTIVATVVEYHTVLNRLTCKVEILDAGGRLLAKGQYSSGVTETP